MNSPYNYDITKMEDWYGVYRKKLFKEVKEFGGTGIFHHHKSISRGMASYILIFFAALRHSYPEYAWDISKFNKEHNYWSVLKNQRSFFDHLSVKFSIQFAWHSFTNNTSTIFRIGTKFQQLMFVLVEVIEYYHYIKVLL